MTRKNNLIFKVSQYFLFNFILIKNGLNILLKKNKKLSKEYFYYQKNWVFDRSYLFVYLTFKNSIYYTIEGYKSFDFKKPLILDLQNFDSNNVVLIVYGLFQKQIYTININKEFKIDSSKFISKINNFRDVIISDNNLEINLSEIIFNTSCPKIILNNYPIKSDLITTKFSPFIIQEYL